MDWPAVHPWSDLPDEGFLRDVLQARQQARHLFGEDVHIQAEGLVSANTPMSVRWATSPLHESSSLRLGRVAYSSIVHNRPDVLDDRDRLLRIVMALLSDRNVDELAGARIVDSGSGDFWLLSGNHRLVAQSVVGMVPWAWIEA